MHLLLMLAFYLLNCAKFLRADFLNYPSNLLSFLLFFDKYQGEKS